MKLSRREAILLVLLLIFAVLFAEYHLVVTPGLEKHIELESRNDELTAQIDSINLDLQIAEQKKEQRDETLQEISVYHERFLGELNSSILLYYTYDLMTRNDFLPNAYTISPVMDAIPFVELVAEHDITYELAELVAEYYRLRGITEDEEETDPSADETDAEVEDESESSIASLELNEFLVNGNGTYEQMKGLLDDIQQLNKSIVVSLFDMNAAENDTIEFSLRIQYFGVSKFDLDSDEFNTWTRPSFNGGDESPFATIISETENDVIADETTTDDVILETE